MNLFKMKDYNNIKVKKIIIKNCMKILDNNLKMLIQINPQNMKIKYNNLKVNWKNKNHKILELKLNLKRNLLYFSKNYHLQKDKLIIKLENLLAVKKKIKG